MPFLSQLVLFFVRELRDKIACLFYRVALRVHEQPLRIASKLIGADLVMEQGKAFFLEDLSVGQSFSAGPIGVTEEAIIAFAKQFDPQPFHTDPQAAKNTFFQGLAASGWHTAAMTMRLLNEGALPFGAGAIGLGGEISWPRPVRAGDELRAESEILDIKPSRSKPNQAIVTVKTTTTNQKGETVQILTSKIIAFSRASLAGAV